MNNLSTIFLYSYYKLSFVTIPRELRYEPHRRTFDSYTDSQVRMLFRFRSVDQLRRLKQGFQFPDQITLPSRHIFSGEEAVLILLYRFHYPEPLSDLEREFGRDYTTCSKIFNWALEFLISNWTPLLTNRFQFFKQFIPLFHQKIAEKYRKILHEDPPADFRVFWFIDSTMNAICRPGGGPVSPGGVGADRFDPIIQRAFYTGYKKLHGLKLQTVGLPNGMHMHVSQAFSARHTDAYLYGHSGVNDALESLFQGEAEKYQILGDAAYGSIEYLVNKGPPQLRISIEWNYEEVKGYFQLINYKRLLKIHMTNLPALFFVALLLHNSFVAMNGSLAATFYEIETTQLFTFEDWLKGKDRN